MIGDAMGDYQAAQANGTLFFPINPGAEEASWRRFVEEGVDRFLAGKFDEAYQKSLVDEFDRYLPATPAVAGELNERHRSPHWRSQSTLPTTNHKY